MQTEAVRGKFDGIKIGGYVRPVLLGLLTGTAAMGLLLCLTAWLFDAFHMAGEFLPGAAIGIAALSGLISGFVSARLRNRRGFLTGGCSAVLLAGILLIVGWLTGKLPGAAALTRAAVIAAAGMTGGVLGIRKNSRKY